jgi:phosphatidylglycerol---prolipoprotein diacylglyceryl transferase
VTWDINPTFLGPWELPWHALFVVLELAIVGYLVVHWRKHGKITWNELSWLAVAGVAHAFYAARLAEDNPDFTLEIRYYGVFFAVGLLLAARSMPLYFERWGFPRNHGEALCLWTPVGMLLGAHLVHLVFYEPQSFINNPIRILQIGSGLASHGGGLGAILAVVLFARRHRLGARQTMRYMDPAMCAATWVIPWVRVGNWFNSEIVGRAWDGPWAVFFPRHECPQLHLHEGPTLELCQEFLAARGLELQSRHPSQIYEALLAFVMVGIAVYLQRRWRNRLRPGAHLFILLGYYFTTRFFIEYVKDYQALSESFPFTMGQMLSLPIVAISAYMLFFSKLSNIRTPLTAEELAANAAADAPPPQPKSKKAKAGPAADAGKGGDASGGDEGAAKRTKKRKKKKS